MTHSANTFEGGCTCGGVRYRMVSKPLIVHGCHCTWCQRQTGTVFAVNALIETDRVEVLKGAVVEITVDSPSGAKQRIARCPDCQVPVWSNYLCLADNLEESIRFIRVGTLDEPHCLPPDVHIFASSRQPWLNLPADAKVYDEYYDTKETWSEDSFQRRNALISRVKQSNQG
jgi:hypothetical protein